MACLFDVYARKVVLWLQLLLLKKPEKGSNWLGKATENEPKKEHDDVFGVDVWSFELEYVITQKIKVTDPAIAAVKR